MDKKQKLSVIVITRNEEEDIRACLDSVKGVAAEIVVADSGSTDKTLEICRQYTEQVFHCEWRGYAQQKQCALDKALGPWVLNIDADERVTPELREEINAILSSDVDSMPDGFQIPFRTFFLGHELRFGSCWNETHLRLFKKDKARYGTDAVHEGIAVAGAVGRLRGKVNHYSYASLSEYLTKCNLYTSLIAQKKFAQGGRFHLWHHLRLPFEFFSRFVVKLGFLDGLPGFNFALLSSIYVWLKFIKLWELEAK